MSGTNFSIDNNNFTDEDYARMDPRIVQALDGWQANLIHKGLDVNIPATWGSVIYPYKYFEVYKSNDDVDNPGEDESEIQCYVACGWKGMDDEVVIVLTIFGLDAIEDITNNAVGAEIYKFGSDQTKLYRNGRLVTNFTKRWWYFWKTKVDKIFVSNVNSY